MIGYPRKPVPMFGMNDPAQTLMQLENYIRDGRLEMSEVMATQFTNMFLQDKKTWCRGTNNAGERLTDIM